MEINNFSTYNSDNKCYKLKLNNSNKDQLNIDISNYFSVHPFTIKNTSNNENLLKQCESKALEENKSFFVITDVFKNKNGNLDYNCLIPRVDKSYNNFNSLLKPLDDLINNLFIKNYPMPITKKYTLNNIKDIEFKDISQCFYLNENENRVNLSKSGKFIIYKNELIYNEKLKTSLNRVNSYESYKNEYNILFDATDGILHNLEIKNISYMCNKDISKNLLKDALYNLKTHYNKIFTILDNIGTDISNLAILTNYDTLYLEKLQKKIDEKKIEFNNLIGFDGANNGKLSDTKFLKNLKISENIILLITIIFVIFLFTKKKL